MNRNNIPQEKPEYVFLYSAYRSLCKSVPPSKRQENQQKEDVCKER